jgi:PAS domain S-box-containing protein
MSQTKINIIQVQLKEEKVARITAEKLVVKKSKELDILSTQLKKLKKQVKSFSKKELPQSVPISDQLSDATIIIDFSGDVLESNEEARVFFGSRISKRPLSILDFVFEEDLPYALSSFLELQSKGFYKDYETRLYTNSMEVKWVRIHCSLIYDKNNIPIAAKGIIKDITADKFLHNLSLKPENSLSSLIVNLDSALLLEDKNRKIVLINTKFRELFSIEASSEILKAENSFSILNYSEHLFNKPKEFKSRVQNLVLQQKQVLGEEVLLKDGTILERDFIPILKEKKLIGYLWTYKSLSLRNQYKRSLESQKQKYSNIIANLNLGLIEVNKNDEILVVNQSFAEISGYTQTELLGKKGREVFELINDFDRIKIENNKRQDGVSTSYELKIKNKTGTVKNLLISGAPNYNTNGDVIGSIGIHLDITKAKKNEQLLEQKKEELDTIVHNSSLGIVLTKRGRIIKTNYAIQNMLGFSEAELNTFSIKELSFNEDYESFKAYVQKVNEQKKDNFIFTKRYKNKKGVAVWTKTNVNIVRYKDGRVKHQVVFIEDITANREKTIIIDLINNLTKSILDKTDIIDIAGEIVNNIAAYLDSDDCVIYLVNEEKDIIEQIAIYGDKRSDEEKALQTLILLKGTGIVGSAAKFGQSELIADTSKDERYVLDQEKRFSEIAVPIMSNGKAIGVIDSEHKNKNHYTVEHVKTLESIASLVAIKLSTAISIKERKKVELRNEQLVEKLEKTNNELYEYAHTVSHDLKTPLQSIAALVSWVKSDNKEDFNDITKENIRLIEGTVVTMDQLITNILEYSIAGTSLNEQEDVDLNLITDNLMNVLIIPEHITIRIRSKLPVVKGDKTKFQQLFQNLLGNAIKFNKKEKGFIDIIYQEKELYHHFSVKDNGMGIEKKYHEKIFKMFHSLHKSKESTGIGLAIVKKIVYLYEGNIWLDSEPTIGTTFYFTLKK